MNKPFICLVSGVAALGGLLFGFDTAIISGAIPQLRTVFRLDAGSLGWAVSCVLVGCALGAALAGKLADRYGRWPALFACAVLFAASGIGAALSGNLVIFSLFRIIGGLGVGAAAMVSPMYIAELAPEKQRGMLVSLYQLAIMTGILLAYITSYYLSGRGAQDWRWMFGSQALPAFIFGVLLFLVPDTPRWYVINGRTQEAIKVLIQGGCTLEAARDELLVIENSLKADRKEVRGLRSGRFRPVLVAGILLAVFQQVTGINAILYYAPVIFKETGLNDAASIGQTIGIGVINVIATFIAIGLVDRIGRRRFLLGGSLIMGLALIVTALCFYFNFFSHYIVLIAMLVYVGTFCCSLGAVTWVYLSEIFPNAIRGRALSLATLALWLADFLVAVSFPLLTGSIGSAGTFTVYAACCVLCYLFVWYRLPETKGRPLEEIEQLFI